MKTKSENKKSKRKHKHVWVMYYPKGARKKLFSLTEKCKKCRLKRVEASYYVKRFIYSDSKEHHE